MIWLTVVSGTAAALRLALTDVLQPTGTVELAAVGWPPARRRAATAVASVAVAGLVLTAGAAIAGVRAGALAAVAAALGESPRRIATTGHRRRWVSKYDIACCRQVQTR